MQGKPKTILDRSIEYLKGVGGQRAASLQKELGIFTFGDLLVHYPFRYVDKTKFHKVRDIVTDDNYVQIRGILRRIELVGAGRKKRLVGKFRDESGMIELIWFKGIQWLEKSLQPGSEYVVYGKPAFFRGSPNIPHPDIELVSAANTLNAPTLEPVYPSTERLKGKGMDSKGIRKTMRILLNKIAEEPLPENLPAYLVEKFKLPDRNTALRDIHFATSAPALRRATKRLKFEELFFLQLRMLQLRQRRVVANRGFFFPRIGDYFNTFFKEKLPFSLTNAQKRVIKEIREDMGNHSQMNRLLQGDVGSGKTIVALMCMLIALDNGFQCCLMAPTEILAQQHLISISESLKGMGLQVGLLTGSVKGKKRKQLLAYLKEGGIHILIGTHALIEDEVQFKQLGFAIIDEQHRFGVAQRAKLWKKGQTKFPHVLVMTATPIPRTLAMTVYGDLDVSVIDELPPGRKPVVTLHRNESHRMRVFGFMREQIALGRQVYVVYPLIEESEKLDLNNLEQGHEAISREFPIDKYQISVVHGRMKAKDKDFEMQRFAKGETQIMVATTVIEVGVNVPNASVMVIENTERFGLAQLHQLRGRVGRGADQSYCILMSSYKLSKEGRVRIETMCRTNDGFEIAEADMNLRGPGNIEGTQQSGILNLRLAEIAKDGKILKTAREVAYRILENDPELSKPEHFPLKRFLAHQKAFSKSWSRIS